MACKLCAIVKHQALRHPEAAHYVLPHEVCDLVSRDLRHWLSLYPLRDVL